MHHMTFDIETVPDLDAGRRLYGLEDMGDDDVHAAMTALRIDKAGTDFMPLHLHKVVAISVALRSGDDFKVWSLGERDAGEAEVIGRCFTASRPRATGRSAMATASGASTTTSDASTGATST